MRFALCMPETPRADQYLPIAMPAASASTAAASAAPSASAVAERRVISPTEPLESRSHARNTNAISTLPGASGMQLAAHGA